MVEHNWSSRKKLVAAAKVINKCLKYRTYIHRIPALAYGIIDKDGIVNANGFGRIFPQKKVTDKTLFRIASISKIITTVGVLQLVEKKKLKLNDKVSKYLAWFKSKKDDKVEQITLRQLLSHTSGITRDGDTPHWVTHEFPDAEHIKNYVVSLRLSYPPNEFWKYSNLGYVLLGLVIEKVSGNPYKQYIGENIYKKLGIKYTSTDFNKQTQEELATGHGIEFPNNTRKVFPHVSANSMASATGFVSNVSDLCVFLSAFFKGDSRLLSEKSKRELKKIQWKRKGEDIDQALGFQVWKMDGRKVYSHTGGFAGFKSVVALDLARSIAIMVLMNVIDTTPLDYGKLLFHVINYIFLHEKDFKGNYPSSDSLIQYEGTFLNIWGPKESVVLGNKLVLLHPDADRPLKDAYLLEYEKNHTFIIKSGDGYGNIGESAHFEFDNDGKVYRVYEGATPRDIFHY